MYFLALMFALSWRNGHCGFVQADIGDRALCTEPACLAKELTQLGQALTEQQAIIEEQNKMFAQLRTENSLLRAENSKQASSLQNFKTEQAARVDRLEAKLKSWKELCEGHEETSSDLAPRADDLGPLETVVQQMGQQLATVSADIVALKNAEQQLHGTIQQQDLNIQEARTSAYVHWGSSHCPGDSDLVYTGVVGGSHFTQTGGGTNYLCLSMSPIFATHTLSGYNAFLYGSEYQTYSDAHHDLDAVCAVCRSHFATTIMIPGTNVCTQGWTKQYDGYLMAERHVHNAAQFICVDSAMESRPGTNADLDGRLLYFTLTQCGSLPCGPYENNRIVTCVVCSK